MSPFLFVTGYDRTVAPARWRRIGRVCKPVMGSQVVKAAKALLGRGPLPSAAWRRASQMA